MTDFSFDANKSFSENCEAFLTELETVDAEMAVILCDNWDALVTIVREGERDLRLRAQINTTVARALDNLATSVPPKDGA